MAGDPHLALDLADGVGNAQHQWLEVIDDAGAGRGEQFIATDGHHGAVDGIFHGYATGLDVFHQEACQTRSLNDFRLGHRTVDGLHRDLPQGMNILEHRLGIRRQFHPQPEQQCQQQCQADGHGDPWRHELRQAITGHGHAAPMG